MPNWRKLKSLSANEVRVRLAQQWSSLAERHGLSTLNKLPDDAALIKLFTTSTNSTEQLLDRFRTRTEPAFFAGFNDRRESTEVLRSRWPDHSKQTIDEANEILKGRFKLLGFNGLSFGMPIDWHLEPVSQKRAPLDHWSQLDYLDAEVAGDKKIIWEVNRHQYLTKLGQAYWLTGDEVYASAFVSHLTSWMDQNPPKFGINWASSLEVSFRSISWLWALYFFKDSQSISPSFFSGLLKFLYLHARHLETYLSTYFSPNTHLTGEALGLFYIGTVFPEFKDAARWRSVGESILVEQLPIHVFPDGVYFEQTSYYHRYTTDFYVHFLLLLRANGATLPHQVEDRLNLLLEHLMFIARPDGTSPLFGDDDGGKLLMLERSAANDFRAALSTGAALFARGDYKFGAGDVSVETLFLTGTAGLRVVDQLEAHEPTQQSVAFNSGGYYVMRDGWSKESNYLFFDCGPHGYANCGHAHADALAYELAVAGRSVLVDPGTFTYTGARDLRDWFRSSAAHNTLTINGQSSSISDGPFSWQSIARCKLNRWISRDRFDFASGEHDGYLPSIHERSILFLKHNYWVVRDRVQTEIAQNIDLHFHFNKTGKPLIEATSDKEPGFISDIDGEQGLDIRLFSDTLEQGRWRREDTWISECYGEREPARSYIFSARAKDSQNFVSFLLPVQFEKRFDVRQVEAVGGMAFELLREDSKDLLLIRTGRIVETASLTTNFEWAWLRFASRDSALPEEILLLSGTSLEFRGVNVFQSESHVEWLTARREGNSFVVDSNPSIPIEFAELLEFGNLTSDPYDSH